ncbi:Uncharacterised protein [Bacteroides heparinolyticus]|uniref:Uncharacterized protein n=1 Tax=Prevotella heparinolytica TaxID=28113 RepID=A0A449I1T9_9BACE|nr:Uncharacterised protein [Bacteroides heparinolyticus]
MLLSLFFKVLAGQGIGRRTEKALCLSRSGLYRQHVPDGIFGNRGNSESIVGMFKRIVALIEKTSCVHRTKSFAVNSKLVHCLNKSLFAPCGYKNATCGQMFALCGQISAQCEKSPEIKVKCRLFTHVPPPTSWASGCPVPS